MIRVKKSNIAPASLLSCTLYNGQDVQEQLLADQSNKCYLCEKETCTDYVIEHHKSQKNSPELTTSWLNLLLACSYCNNKKGSHYDNILSPLECNIEEAIEQSINSKAKRAEFCLRTEANTPSAQATIKLLNSIFNGAKGLRNKREERFYEYFLSRMNAFKKALDLYLRETDDAQKEAKIAVEELLRIDSEFLGFKYWFIKENKRLWEDFGAYCIWHKQQFPA